MQTDSLKILFLNLPGTYGDDELILCQVAYGLRKQAKDIAVCCLKGSQLAFKCKTGKIKVITLEPKLQSSKLKLTAFLINLIRKEKYNIIHSTTNSDRGFASAAALATKVRHITSVNNLSPIVESYLDKKLLHGSLNNIITCSKTVKNILVSRDGFDASKIAVVPIGLNPDDFSRDVIKRRNVRGLLGFADDHTVIGNIGKLAPYEGQTLLIEAFADILPLYPRARVVIVGDGELKAELIRIAERFGVHKQVLFAGQREDYSSMYSVFDVYVHTSSNGTKDVFPLTVLKALAYQLPVIVTDVGDNAQFVVNEYNGFLLQGRRTDELAEKLKLIVSQYTLQMTMAKNSYRHFLDYFCLELITFRVTEVYANVLGQFQSSSDS
ncbi:MAG: glycosyltransferase [Bacteroidota bacterium]|nr:glycosyltransferase [Bacteroidota bacterium]